uniref:Putative dna-directed rna polymerase ii subunit rpb1-like protein n=1 Tax=Triatoma dimidiata TaxID=72491 RepID=A0A0V0G4J6_TRIDM
MDSDSSSSDESSGRGGCGDEGGGDESHTRTAGGDWSSDRANSDVSDDENFSRGAKSIDSPPESPPRGGGNLDSPPASPAAPGAGSPAPYSGSDASENSPRPPESPPSYLGSPPPQAQLPRTPPDYFPTSPDAYGPASPASPVNGRSSSVDGPSSPGDGHSSPRDDRSSLGSPDGGRSSTTGGDSSPASLRGSSSVDGHSTPTSPAGRSTSSGGVRRGIRSSITSNVRSPSVGHSSAGEESRSSPCMHTGHTDEMLSPEGRRSGPSSPTGRTSNPLSPADMPSRPSRIRRTSVDRSNSGSPMDEPRSPIRGPASPSESPNASNRLCRRSKGGPSTPQNRPLSPSSPERRYLTSADAPLSPTSPAEGPSSPEGRPATPDSSHRSADGRSSPVHLDRHCSPVDEDSFSPSSPRRRISANKHFISGDRDSFPASPVDGPSSPLGHDEPCASPGEEPASPVRKPSRRRPVSPASSDGRSNISSDSSLGGSPEPTDIPPVPARAKTPSPVRHDKMEIKSHGEDLSDVSDIESLGSVSDNEQDKMLKDIDSEFKEKEISSILNGGNGGGTMALGEEAEQLDFEAEEREELDGQLLEVSSAHQQEGMTSSSNNCNTKDMQSGASTLASGAVGVLGDDEEEGEVKEREDGEISDEGEARPEETEPRPVCRFFSRGQCTWGSSCRFVHPGVTDKGNYTMFDMVRPLVPMNNGPPPPPHLFPGPMDVYTPRAIDRPIIGPGPPPYQQPAVRREEPPGESAWERGLRQAKELLRRSTKRKETDADFEEKKMNLGLSGQDEYDKENDYYTRPTSPIYEDTAYHERYPNKEGEKRYRSVSERFGDYPPPAPYYPPPRGDNTWYEERPSRYHHQSSRHHPSSYQPSSRGGGGNSAPTDDYYERPKRQKYSSREVIVQRSEKTQWKENSPSPRPRGSDRSGRGDEWADPWMRSKSPTRKGSGTMSRSTRKKSYSSRSSYSSSSTSRSSSYSSYSRSGTHSRSTRSRSSRSRSRSPFSRKKMSPLSRRANKSPFSRGERRGQDPERSMHMNPPAPSPRANNTSPTARRNPTPPDSRSNRNLSARLLAAAMRDRSVSRSSRSSSASDSSGSSSDSSSDSGSSSSSSRGPSPTPPPQQRILPVKQQQGRKKIEIDEKLAQAMKVKAMDALKLSGQKQQIKLTLKGPGSGASKERVSAPVVSRKRVADSPLDDEDDDIDSPTVTKKKPAPSRREELLKQLKAVEDAIARKRSKI